MCEQKNYMYGKNNDSKNFPPELTRSKANTKAVAFCHHKFRGINSSFEKELYGFIISRYISFSALAVVLNSNILVLINNYITAWALLASNVS